jgi:uncharacterized protein (TIGR03067 family)
MQTILLAAVGLMAATDKPEADSVKEDKRKLQGNWAVMSVDLGTRSLSFFEGAAKGGRLVFEGDEVIFKGERAAKMAYRIDPNAKPKSIDLVSGKDTIEAIYDLDGDMLRICVGDRKRPTEFVAKPGQEGQTLLILKRTKKP